MEKEKISLKYFLKKYTAISNCKNKGCKTDKNFTKEAKIINLQKSLQISNIMLLHRC